MTLHESVFDEAIAELRRRSRLSLYQRDFAAWSADVLRLHNYEKMRMIADDMLFAEKERTMVKSANGTGKSVLVAQLILWAGSVWPEGDTISIISAPSIPQLQKVTFGYLKDYHGRVSKTLSPRDFRVPGRIDENLGWVSETPSGKIWLATGRKPPDQDAVSMFQGLRSKIGMTYVWFDEAGGMSRAMFTAAEAVQTGEGSRFGGIGNPDNSGTEFQHIYTDPEKASEYNLHTLSAYDTPIFTGERVYPRTPEGDEMEARMLRALTSKRWVAHKTRIWASGGRIEPDPEFPHDRRYDRRVDDVVAEPFDSGNPEHLGRELTPDKKFVVISRNPMKWDARGLSKVLGEFPGDADYAFFPQASITEAHNTDIVEDFNVRPVFGVDVARFGSDESVIYSNTGGRVRLLDSWGKADTVETARRVHEHAMRMNASEVRVDAVGVGGGVFDMLKTLDEFADKCYLLIGVDGARRSPDPRRWANSRAYNHEQLREKLVSGSLDLDIDDRELSDQLLAVTFKFTKAQGAIQITPKDEMRTEMDGSPDRLDALIYSVIDTSSLTAPVDPNVPKKGDIVLLDPWEMLAESRLDPTYPL